eukprot:TRINITY_DN81619_c0_g1_i1.p1 TRINITY_DN81619_c0_g1~~TRINITY_DN81619_c0_g1_i1.p1  ORF type:complete len:244 (-),score=63.41 TRINITY_DN81619_c0_g1_i1:336-1067(-)
MQRAVVAVAAAACMQGSVAQAPQDDPEHFGECTWLEHAMMSGMTDQLDSSGRFAQLKVTCGRFLSKLQTKVERSEAAGPAARKADKAEAHKRKEVIEDKCAWYHKSQESGGGGSEMAGTAWYLELQVLCSGVPKAELEDNLTNLARGQCTWFEMALLSGRLQRHTQEAWYTELEESCRPVIKAASHVGGATGVLPQNGKPVDSDFTGAVMLPRGFQPRPGAWQGGSDAKDQTVVRQSDAPIHV